MQKASIIRRITFTVLLLLGCLSAACAKTAPAGATALPSYGDGIYRGFYSDGGIEQLSVEFELKGGRFQSVLFRSINYKDGNYLAADATRIQSQVASQFAEAADYLTGKDLTALAALLDSTGVISDRDAVTAATLRTNKLASAIQDGLNRGVFRVTESTRLSLPESAEEGAYRGFYYDEGVEQVFVEFTVSGGRFQDVRLRTLSSGGIDYLAGYSFTGILDSAALITDAVASLSDQPLGALQQLYNIKMPIDSPDALLMSKVLSAFFDGFARGVYQPFDAAALAPLSGYADGIYRGFYCEGGVEQVSIQFELFSNTFVSVRFRSLGYEDGDYLSEDASAGQLAVRHQYQALVDALIGQDLSALYELYQPSGLIPEVDGCSSATLCGNKLVSAIMNGLSRGVYIATSED